MQVTIIGGGAVQHNGKLYLPGSLLECEDKDGSYLIDVGVASPVADSAPERGEGPPENKAGGSKKGK